jgi:hypothetical protein
MKTIDDIRNYTEEYAELWYIIDINDSKYPIMESPCELLDEVDYMGVDFSNDKSVYQLFTAGSSDYMSAIAFPHDKKISMDECPVYLFNFDEIDTIERIGNFKSYMIGILNNFIEKSDIKLHEDDEHDKKYYKKEAMKALKDLNTFSDGIISYNYKIKRAEE